MNENEKYLNYLMSLLQNLHFLNHLQISAFLFVFTSIYSGPFYKNLWFVKQTHILDTNLLEMTSGFFFLIELKIQTIHFKINKKKVFNSRHLMFIVKKQKETNVWWNKNIIMNSRICFFLPVYFLNSLCKISGFDSLFFVICGWKFQSFEDII